MPSTSLKSIVLRYSNQEGPSIESHSALTELHGYAWWGWWRKEFEPNRLDTLRQLSRLLRRGPVRIALINRKDDTWHVAECTEVQFSDAGERILSPEPDLVPSYYNGAACSAWFRISQPRPIVTQRIYEDEFGPVPTGEPTLYEVRKRRNGTLEVLPKPHWQITPVTTAGNAILHLSDLHFGVSHAYQTEKQAVGQSVAAKSLSDVLVDRLQKSSHDVGVIVISGDLISKGSSDDFDLVEAFLTELGDGLGLTPAHMVIAPGNHDFKVIADTEKPTLDYRHERAFRRFLGQLHQDSTIELERLQRYSTPSGWELSFVALNSARLRGDETKEYGYVGRHRYEDMLRFLQESIGKATDPGAHRLGLAVLHHHILPVQPLSTPSHGRPLSLTVDAAEICAVLQDMSIGVVMHGHQHLPFIAAYRGAQVVGDRWTWPADRAALHILGNGSTGANSSELCPELPYNTFGVYWPTDDGMRVVMEKFLPGVEPAPFLDELIEW